MKRTAVIIFLVLILAPAAQAHRYTEAVATRKITTFIHHYQCEGNPLWACDEVFPVFPIRYRNHSWKWGPGVYFRQSWAVFDRLCQSSGVLVSHDSGSLLGNHIYGLPPHRTVWSDC